MAASAPLWPVLLVPVILGGFTVAAVTADAVLAARAAGRPAGRAVLDPLAGAARRGCWPGSVVSPWHRTRCCGGWGCGRCRPPGCWPRW
ncbi:MAG: hypothetical protein ACYCPF_02690 [Streptosporangiaceae bacterium]